MKRFLFFMFVVLWSCQSASTDPTAEAPVDFNAVQLQMDEVTADQDALEIGQKKTADKIPDVKKPVVKPKQPVKKAAKKQQNYKPAIIQIITNFDKADATVNGLPYPEYVPVGEPDGMVVPAGGPYTVIVRYGEKSKTYNLHLRPYETRMLFVELSGYQQSTSPPPAKEKKTAKKAEPEKKKADDKKEEKKGPGKVTVYSKPPGTIMADGKKLGDKTPGTVELENGRHEIQVEYESGQVSEKKIVRVRDGSRIKLFFRERKK